MLAASGWIDLGNYEEANAELDQIQPLLRIHPDVLKVRWSIYAVAKNWEGAVHIANAIRECAPNDPFGWVHAAYALRRSEGLEEAFQALIPAEKQFPKCEIIPYNLACYTAQLGDLKRAKIWLEKAITIGNSTKLKSMALDDPDLAPLWQEIGSL